MDSITFSIEEYVVNRRRVVVSRVRIEITDDNGLTHIVSDKSSIGRIKLNTNRSYVYNVIDTENNNVVSTGVMNGLHKTLVCEKILEMY